jgi:hypothetical protein
VIGREAVRARMVLEVAQQLDEAGIVTISMAVMADDLIAVSIPNLCDFHKALKIFDAGHGRSSWRGIVVRIHMGRRMRGANLAMASADAHSDILDGRPCGDAA